MTIGYVNPGYPVIRNVLIGLKGVAYKRSRSFASLITKVLRPLFGNIQWLNDLGMAYIGGTSSRGVDVFHFFNTISVWPRGTRFVTTFETSLPRCKGTGYWFRAMLKRLVDARCLRLLAMSECARQIQIRALVRYRDRGWLTHADQKTIEGKIQVLHPRQEVFATAEEIRTRFSVFESPGKHVIRFFYIGRNFFRKGGADSVKALMKIRKTYPVELVVIGDPFDQDYASDPKLDDGKAMEDFLKDNSDWISWFRRMDNAMALELMKTCHVGLLPTRADTYGYSVLEMQACGLPCVTTNIRALPEINNAECGWIVEVPKNENGEAFYQTKEDVAKLSGQIVSGLEKCFAEICSNPGLLLPRALASLERIKRYHDPDLYGAKLRAIYEESQS